MLYGTLVAGDTYVIANSSAAVAITSIADVLSSTVINFNGDDAVSLDRVADSSHVDVFGQIGFRPTVPGSYCGDTTLNTLNHTLVRKSSILKGDPDGSNVFDPSVEWNFYAQDTYTYLGTHTMADDGFIISEYIEGSSNNKAIELYNGTLGSIDLAGYKFCLYSNGSATVSATLVLSGTLVAGDTYVIANASAVVGITSKADVQN